MATTMAGAPITSGGFVLKSVRTGKLERSNTQTFSVQNEGDFCIISKDLSSSSYRFSISKIDDIPVDIKTEAINIVFGKNIVAVANGSDFYYHIYEYGPAE